LTGEPPCNQEYACRLEQRLDDEAEPVIAQRKGTAAKLDFLPAVNAWWAAKGDIFDRVDGAFPTTRA
jgi:hypothetical protein